MEACHRATSDLQPASIEEELQEGEYGHVEVQVVVRVALRRVQELAANQAHQEEAIHSQSHHLEGEGGATRSHDRQRTLRYKLLWPTVWLCFVLFCFSSWCSE